jgi:hypothetical protein
MISPPNAVVRRRIGDARLWSEQYRSSPRYGAARRGRVLSRCPASARIHEKMLAGGRAQRAAHDGETADELRHG